MLIDCWLASLLKKKPKVAIVFISIAGLLWFWPDDLQGVDSFGIAHAED